jgi:hypothetical protein
MRIIGCIRLGELGAPSCCSSCHEDEEDFRYELPEVELEDDLVVITCCAKLDWVKENKNLLRKEKHDGETGLLD